MSTEYTDANGDFSNRAHQAARGLIYPLIFKTNDLGFEDTLLKDGDARAKVLDGEMGVDRIVRVGVPGLKAPLTHTIQERFRRISFLRRYPTEVTITAWNGATNLPSELHKITAGLFLYGFFDEDRAMFRNVSCLDTTRLLYSMGIGALTWKEQRNPKKQVFICFDTSCLRSAEHVVVFEQRVVA